MDQPDVEQRELLRGLRDLQRVNRWIGGARVALAPVLPLLRESHPTALRVLDVATGSADIPLALARRARDDGVPMEIVATDSHPATLEAARVYAARDPGVRVEYADALSLPYPDDSFDIAMCHTALHHFDPPGAVTLLGELNRVARRAVVVSDLVRSWTGLLAVHLLAATVWRRHPVSRHDGPSSFRAAYTPAELRSMAARASLRDVRVRRYVRFARMSLLARPSEAANAARLG